MTPKQPMKASVHLIAYDSTGQPVLEQNLSWQQYSERSHPLLDSPSYRKDRHIVRLSGVVTDQKGQSSEEFEVRFDQSGLCVCDAARLADGTVLGDWEHLHGTHATGSTTINQ
jgi:hypothetical protein